MSDFRGIAISSRSVLGFCVVLVGVLLTASNLGLVRPFEFWQFFPLGLTVIGVARLVDCRSPGSRWFSIALIIVGLWWTLDNVYYIPFHIWRWWPVGLVVFGLMLVMRSREQRPLSPPPPPGSYPPPFGGSTSFGSNSDGTDAGSSSFGGSTAGSASAAGATSGFTGGPGSAPFNTGASSFGGAASSSPGADLDETLTAVAFWSGSRRRSASQSFRSADAIAVMGGVELDLRQASTATGEATLEVFAMWGSVKVRVPPDWTIINEVVPIMGGSDDRTTSTQPAKHRLRVRGMVVMGGVDIRS